MPTVILLGIPQGYIGNAKSSVAAASGALKDWAFKYVPTHGKFPEISRPLIERACVIAAQYAQSHVLGFSGQQNRQIFAQQIKPYFRFKWFDHSMLSCLGSPDSSPFAHALACSLVEEREWADQIKPQTLASPLLLPECSFGVSGRHRDLWRHAESYGDLNNIGGARKAIESFSMTYRRKIELKGCSKHGWVDDNGRIYDDDGPRHGAAPFPRGWKYSYQIESGFHFDVKDSKRRRFSVVDAVGDRHEISKHGHINIDPHGYVPH